MSVKPMIPVHFHIYDPSRSIFKGTGRDKAKSFIVYCNNSYNCGLFTRGECARRSTFGWHNCPYGKNGGSYGFTKKALKFRDWMRNQRERFDGVGTLKSHSDVMAVVGDYVFLPYAHMSMNESIPFLKHSHFFANGTAMVPIEKFTDEAVLNIVNFRPMAMMGGEITSYQKESVPLFLKHLSEQMPDLFEAVKAKSEKVSEIYAAFTNIGREAKLRTLTAGIGKFVDIHGGKWSWDGEYLSSINSRASFLLVEEISEMKIKPSGDPVVKITDEGQVNKSTVFTS